MEVISFGVGVMSLAGLFSACIDCFDLVQKGRYLGKDYFLLETKFENQRLRLIAWGQACGMMNAEGNDNRLDSEELKSRIQITLTNLSMLFKDGTQLKRKYGLKEEGQTRFAPSTSMSSLITATAWNGASLGQRFQEFKYRMQKTRKQASLASSGRWAIEDKRKFTELIQHLKDLIDDLEGLTRFLDVVERQREMIEDEVQSITDIPTLETMSEARLGNTDAVSAAAGLRLWKLRDRHLASEEPDIIVAQTRADISHPISGPEEWDMLADESDQLPILGEDVEYQVLHKVRCNDKTTSRIFLDRPSYLNGQRDADQWAFLDRKYPTSEEEGCHLSGRRDIPSLEDYLKQNCSLNFIVFNHYQCCDGASRRRDSRSLPVGQSIRLLSKDLCAALVKLSQASSHQPTFPDFEVDAELRSPYLWFYPARTSIMRDIETLKVVDAHLVTNVFEVITGFMDSEYATVDVLLSRKAITWRYVHYIYLQGEILLVPAPKKRVEHDRAYELTTWPQSPEAGSQASFIKLDIRSWEFDGNFQLVHTATEISKSEFDDSEDQESRICSLPTFPLRYADKVAKPRLERRGLAFWELRTGRYVSYSGSSAESADPVNSRFMVDCVSFRKWDCNPSPRDAALEDDLGAVQTARDGPPDGNFVLLLPPTLPGYDLQRKRWLNLSVAFISPITWQERVFEKLYIDETTKELLMALVTKGTKSKSKQDEGTVDSLILLFYGAPGTGKTFAAESIAEIAKKPLLRLSLADMVSKPAADLEKFIELIHKIDKSWDCVLLLEDADVILEEKSLNDIGRNALVASFMRLVDGQIRTLILKSCRVLRARSRVGHFDEAFRSRINLAVHFEPLGPKQREVIWRSCLTRIQLSEFAEADLLKHVDRLARINMNGRQIRKAVSGAQKLASHKNRSLDYSTLRQVLGPSTQFDEYISKVRGGPNFDRTKRDLATR